MAMKLPIDVDKINLVQLESFCLFIGHGRSGHSMIGSFIDAHEHAVISHELDVIGKMKTGINRNILFNMILERAKNYRDKSKSGYFYVINSPWQGRAESLRVIGDKRGQGTTNHLSADPTLLKQLERLVGIPIKIIYVIRNPFDTIASKILHNYKSLDHLEFAINYYFHCCEVIKEVKKQINPSNWIELKHEHFVYDPRTELCRVLRFLNLNIDKNHINSCASIVNKCPHRIRFECQGWTKQLVSKAEQLIQFYPYLQEYSWNS